MANEMTDEIELLRACLGGSSSAFGTIVEKYQSLICAITYSATGNTAISEELAQEAFINAWKNLSNLKDLSKFRGWLCSIARNVVLQNRRNEKLHIISGGVPMDSFDNAKHKGTEPVDTAISREQEAVVRAALERISEEYREPLVLFYREDQSVREVAQQLELSEEAVRQRLSRARLMLKNEVEMMIENTVSRSRPGRAFTTAVMAGIAGIGVGVSGAAAGIALTGSGTGAAVAGGSTILGGLAAKILTAAAVVAVSVAAAVAYKQVAKPSFGAEVVQKQELAQEKSKEEGNGQPGEKTANLLISEKSKSDLENSKLPTASTEAVITVNTVRFGIHVFAEEANKPIADAKLRVNRGCGCNCEPDYYSTDANGFYLIDFGKNKPSYLSVLVTKAGYVPMMFAWRDKMIENLGSEFSFYLPKGNKVGGVIEDENSQPIASAKVMLSMYVDESREDAWIRIDDYTVTTDANGRWQCDIFPDEPRQFSVKLQHPDYANTRIWVNERDYKFEDFYSGKSKLVMKEGALLSGLVVNSQGIPVEGATVFTCEDRFDSDAPKAKTDSQGQFKFSHFMPSWTRDKVVLTVQAKGYGPELKVLPVHRDMEPVLISLGQPQTIRVQVVDANGKPIKGAGVDVDNWRGYRSLSWRSSTDESGRFVWNEAPADQVDQVDIDIYKDGYMRVGNQFFTARDEEYKIVMLPPLVISGTVVDADTNEPIRDFTAMKGVDWGGGNLHWETPTQFGYSGNFTGGKYKLAIDQPYPGHLVRIDAEGYLPAKSRVFDSNEGSVTYDFRLKKGSGRSGIVYDANGLPAEGAKIYAVMQNKHLSFENGKPSNQPQDNEWAVTNEDGSFSFKGLLDDSSYKFVVIHDEGFAEVSKEQWLKDPNIILQKWGRVEGTLYSGLGVAGNQSVYYYNPETDNNPERMNYYYAITSTTDDKGHFAIERVIPGKGAVSRRIVSDGGGRISYSHTKQIEITAGQTANVDIGGGGRLVRGRLIKPEWAVGTTDIQNTNPSISAAQTQKINPYKVYADMGFEFPRPQRFDEMTVAEVMQWFMEWTKSDEGKAFIKKIEERMKELQPERTMINYNVITESDGSFTILDVLPGEYVLSGHLRKSDARGYPDYKEQQVVAEVKHTFTVDDITEENQDIPIELGEIEFAQVAKLEPNAPLPDFSVRSPDGGELSLVDFRGKYLLLTFYMIIGEENLKKDMANLKRIQDDFAGDERFKMVGLTHGGMPLIEELAKKFLVEQGLTWQQGFIDGSNYELIQTLKIQNWPHSFLIDPNGIVLINGLKGNELYNAVADALAK